MFLNNFLLKMNQVQKIYKIFLKKLKRKILKKDINKNFNLQKKSLSKEIKKIIEEIELFLKKI